MRKKVMKAANGMETRYSVVKVESDSVEIAYVNEYAPPGAEAFKSYEWHMVTTRNGAVQRGWLVERGSKKKVSELQVAVLGKQEHPGSTTTINLTGDLAGSIQTKAGTFKIERLKLTEYLPKEVDGPDFWDLGCLWFFTPSKVRVPGSILIEAISENVKFGTVRSSAMIMNLSMINTIAKALEDKKHPDHAKMRSLIFGTPDPSFGQVTRSDVDSMN